ncbi:MAG: hypothetical protein QM766_18335 [Burkholderiaceae bacterium]
MSFRLKLVTPPADAATYRGLRFVSLWRDEQGAMTRNIDPVLGPMVGTHIEYGALFAYLVRRFGPPNARCDAVHLARYVLSTPRQDMFLIVEPTIEGRTDEVFSFVVPAAAVASCDRYGLRLAVESAKKGTALAARPQQLRHWADDDPLRPYALAAARTLQALQTPVSLDEDGAIDIFGPAPRTVRALKPAHVGWHHDGAVVPGHRPARRRAPR